MKAKYLKSTKTTVQNETVNVAIRKCHWQFGERLEISFFLQNGHSRSISLYNEEAETFIRRCIESAKSDIGDNPSYNYGDKELYVIQAANQPQ